MNEKRLNMEQKEEYESKINELNEQHQNNIKVKEGLTKDRCQKEIDQLKSQIQRLEEQKRESEEQYQNLENEFNSLKHTNNIFSNKITELEEERMKNYQEIREDAASQLARLEIQHTFYSDSSDNDHSSV